MVLALLVLGPTRLASSARTLGKLTRELRKGTEAVPNLVEELLHSRVHVVLAHGRGCIEPTGPDTGGNGNMCPKLLTRMVDAIHRAGAQDVLRLGMWDDTGAYPGNRNIVKGLPWETLFDLSDTTSWAFFWDHNMKIWFDTIPSNTFGVTYFF